MATRLASVLVDYETCCVYVAVQAGQGKETRMEVLEGEGALLPHMTTTFVCAYIVLQIYCSIHPLCTYFKFNNLSITYISLKK